MKSLVTGGAGFIGSSLVEQLVKLGHKVIVLDNLSTGRLSSLNLVKKEIQFVNIDISDSNQFLDNYFDEIDWVFHLAGIADIGASVTYPSNFFNTNVKGTLNVLEAAKKAKIKKFIYAASASCYGTSDQYPTNEKTRINPKNPYATTKFLGEQLVIDWAKIYHMPNISLRFFNVYGLRSKSKKGYGAVFSIFLTQKLAKAPLTIIGDGYQTRDFVHVSDVVEAIMAAARREDNGEIYNVGTGEEVTINKIAEIIGGNKIYVSKRTDEIERSVADISKIKKMLKWHPKISIENGIQMLLQNIDDWINCPVYTPENTIEVTKN